MRLYNNFEGILEDLGLDMKLANMVEATSQTLNTPSLFKIIKKFGTSIFERDSEALKNSKKLHARTEKIPMFL